MSGGLWADITDLENPTAPNAADALAASSYLMWVLTGRKWAGIKQITEIYDCINGQQCSGDWWLTADEWAYARTRLAVFADDPFWGHLPGQRFLFLRHRPVRELVEVRKTCCGQESVPIEGLAVYDYAFIAPSGPGACDVCFDPCGLEVTYKWGSVPPAAGRIAAIDLANELVKSIECPDECRLPERVTSVNRQGLSYQMFDPQDYLDDGRVGLYSCDSFIKAVNPNRAQLPAKVFSVDRPMGRRRTDLSVAPHRRLATATLQREVPREAVVKSVQRVVDVAESGSGWFPINHDLGTQWAEVAVYDPEGQRVEAADITRVNSARLDVTLNDVAPGSYTVVVLSRS